MAGWLLPLLLSGASVGANYIGARQADKAQAQTMAAERLRQQRLDEEAYALNTRSQERFKGAEDTSERAADLASMFMQPVDEQPATAAPALVPSSSNLVVDAEAAAGEKTAAMSADRAARLGKLRAFGDMFGDASIGMGQDASQLGLIGSFRRGSENVLPLELQAAGQKGQGWMMLGDLLNMGAGLSLNRVLGAGAGAATRGIGSVRPRQNPFY